MNVHSTVFTDIRLELFTYIVTNPLFEAPAMVDLGSALFTDSIRPSLRAYDALQENWHVFYHHSVQRTFLCAHEPLAYSRVDLFP
jgi:hypothetical protein